GAHVVFDQAQAERYITRKRLTKTGRSRRTSIYRRSLILSSVPAGIGGKTPAGSPSLPIDRAGLLPLRTHPKIGRLPP
ncbi:MAG TPA: hypothetical protein VLK65_23850, partial [Vicinamibacteria bacterium]|nr:hypothetical protein [Vicinamibacteria bacterium]